MPAQVAGKIIGAIAHFLGHLGDPLAGPDIDSGMVLQSAAYRGGGEVEHPGDIINGNVFFRDHSMGLGEQGVKVRVFKNSDAIGYNSKKSL